MPPMLLSLPLLLALMHALEHGLNIDLRLETLPLNPPLELSQLHLELLLPSFPFCVHICFSGFRCS